MYIHAHCETGPWTYYRTHYWRRTLYGMHSGCTNTMGRITSASTMSLGLQNVGGMYKYDLLFCTLIHVALSGV